MECYFICYQHAYDRSGIIRLRNHIKLVFLQLLCFAMRPIFLKRILIFHVEGTGTQYDYIKPLIMHSMS